MSASPHRYNQTYVCTTLVRYSTNFLPSTPLLLLDHKVMIIMTTKHIDSKTLLRAKTLGTLGFGFCSSPGMANRFHCTHQLLLAAVMFGQNSNVTFELCGECWDGLVMAAIAWGGRGQDECRLQSRAVVLNLAAL